MAWPWIVLDALLAPIVAAPIAAALITVGVVGGALWAGWSRDRDCERRGWRDLSRW